jgi:hypothetical protein
MIKRIIHLSDLHFPSRDRGVAQVLAECIVNRLPNIIVVTGDIANHPSPGCAINRGAWIAARTWLAGIQEQIDKRATSPERKCKVVILTGNHDVLLSGLSGWCWPAILAFNSVFREWRGPQVDYDASANLTLMTLDTNPRWAVLSAKGKALGRRLKALRRAIDDHPESSQIRSSTKILLMHHHPLPVPFQGPDWLLETRRVDRLLQFLGENKIDLLLHGHKHRATWSHLRVGGTSYEPFFIETMGAGSAMKRDDYDPRGHNFNMIDVAPGGARRLRQFFKPPAAGGFAEVEASPAEERVSRLIATHFRQSYSVRRLTWNVVASEEGDGRNQLTYSGLVFNRSGENYDIVLPEDDSESGQSLPYSSLRMTPEEFPARMSGRDLEGRVRTVVSLGRRPIEASPVELFVENYTLNTYSMDRREAAERALPDPERDSLDFLLMDAVDELCFSATFPDVFRFAGVRVEVLEPLDFPDVVHEDLSRKFAGAATVADNTLTVTLPKPPPNYRYRVSWALPPAPISISPEGNARRAQFEKVFLSASLAAVSAIVEVFADLSSEVEKLVCERNSLKGGVAVVDASTDLSVMVRPVRSHSPSATRGLE